MFKCIYRKNDGSKDNLLLDKKTRDLAFKQAKELNLTVIEMIHCGKLKTSLLFSKTSSSSLKFIVPMPKKATFFRGCHELA